MKRAIVIAALLALAHPAYGEWIHARNGVSYPLTPRPSGWQPTWSDSSPHQIQTAENAADLKAPLLLVEMQPKVDGTVAQVEAALATELTRAGVAFGGEKVTSFAITAKAKKVKTRDLSDHSDAVRSIDIAAGTATINGRAARYAIATDPKGASRLSSVLVGIAAKGADADAEKAAFEGFDFMVANAFHTKSPLEQAKENPKQASRPYVPILDPYIALDEVTATSTLPEKAGGAPALRAVQFDVADPLISMPTTAWCEGKPGDGVGETLAIRLARPAFIDDIWIASGRWTTEQTFADSNKPTRLTVSFGDKVKTVDVQPGRRWTRVEVGWGYDAFTIKIDAVAKAKINDTCISGIKFTSKDRTMVVVRGMDTAALGALKNGVAKIYDGRDKAKLPRAYNTADTRSNVAFKQIGPSELELTFPYEGETLDTWRIAWTAGEWKLAGTGTRKVPQ